MNDEEKSALQAAADTAARRAVELAKREARLAQALRDNLRRRKAPPQSATDDNS
jgi:hypothetical protein